MVGPRPESDLARIGWPRTRPGRGRQRRVRASPWVRLPSSESAPRSPCARRRWPISA